LLASPVVKPGAEAVKDAIQYNNLERVLGVKSFVLGKKGIS
jgi:hypothetical protein